MYSNGFSPYDVRFISSSYCVMQSCNFLFWSSQFLHTASSPISFIDKNIIQTFFFFVFNIIFEWLLDKERQ